MAGSINLMDEAARQASSCSLHQQPPPPQQQQTAWDQNNFMTSAEHVVMRRQNSCESGRDTPQSSVCTIKSPPPGGPNQRHPHQPHYYTDDSEMPAWKIYAKELYQKEKKKF